MALFLRELLIAGFLVEQKPIFSLQVINAA